MEQQTEPVTEKLPEPAAIEPAEGAVISLLNEQMTEWVKDYKRSQLDSICDFTEKCEPVPERYYWGDGEAYTKHLRYERAEMMDRDLNTCTGDSRAT